MQARAKKPNMNPLVIIVLATWLPVVTLQQLCNETLSREQRMAKIADTILLKVGMQEPPANPTSPVVPSDEMMAEYKAVEVALSFKQPGGAVDSQSSQQQCALQFEIAETADLIYPTFRFEVPSSPEDFFIDLPPCENPVQKRQAREDDNAPECDRIDTPSLSYLFTFPLNLTNRVLMSLDLVTFKIPSPTFGYAGMPPNSGGSERVEINLLYPFPCQGDAYCIKSELQMHEVITGKLVTNEAEGFEVFNITRAVQRWIKQLELVEPVGDLKLEIYIRPPVSLYIKDQPFPPSLSFNLTQTHLLVSFKTVDQIVQQQRKRQAGVTPVDSQFCLEQPTTTNCCIKELAINFASDLGWDWVLMPPLFYPNYCLGLCPFQWPTASNATSIFQLYHELNPTGAVDPCCSTHNLFSLPILAILDGIMTIKTIPDVIIESCICK